MRRGRWNLGAFALVCLVLAASLMAADWPQWRGPHRDGQVADFKAPKQWPAELEQVWQVDVGIGHSSPIVVGDRTFVFTRIDEEEVLTALHLADGKEVWRRSYPAPYEVNNAAAAHGKGPKSTPAAADGRIYTLGIGGTLTCWDQEGKRLWRKEFSDQFKQTSPLYGAAASPLIDEGRCIVPIGGNDNGALAAFDAKTGEEGWSWTGDGPAYASPIVTVISDTRQIITQSQNFCCGIDAAEGTLLWKIPFQTDYAQNAVTPILYDESVIFSGFNKGISRYRIEMREDQWHTEEIWENKEVSLYMSSPVVAGERLCGFSQKKRGQLFALDLTTGQTLWTGAGRLADNAAVVRTGSAIWALTNKGELIAFKDSEKEFEQLARYKVSETSTWAHPVILPQGILIKDETKLTLWKLKKPPKGEKPAATEPKAAETKSEPKAAEAKPAEAKPEETKSPETKANAETSPPTIGGASGNSK